MKRCFMKACSYLIRSTVGIGALAGLAPPSALAEAAAPPPLPRFVQADLGIPGVTLDDRGITVKSSDDAVQFRIGGRLQLDPAFGGTSPRIANGFGSNIEVRRAWIETYLTINKAIELAFQYDLNTDRTPIQDAAIGYHGIDGLVVSLGNFKEPFSLQQQISDNTTPFVERAVLDALVPPRNTGLTVGGYGDLWTLTAVVFGG